MRILRDEHNYRMYWHDEAEQICVLQIIGHLSAEDMIEVTLLGNAQIGESKRRNPRRIYSIVYLSNSDVSLIRESFNREKFRTLVEMDAQHEELIFLAGEIRQPVQFFLNRLKEFNHISPKLWKYRYVNTFEEAVTAIYAYEKHLVALRVQA